MSSESATMPCRLVSWDEVTKLCRELAIKVEGSGFQPDSIIALARSGFVPGRLLSDRLGITDLVSLKVEHWLDTTGAHREEATIPYRIPLNVKGRNILVVDDIVDTGKSMKAAVQYVEGFEPHVVKTAVMQYITTSEVRPDYYAMLVNQWIWFIYPWNYTEDMCNLVSRLVKASPRPLSASEISTALRERHGIAVKEEAVEEILEILRRRGGQAETHKLG